MKNNIINDGSTAHEIECGELGKAYFLPLDPLIDENGRPNMPIYYCFPVGSGDSISEDSALVRPLRKIIRDGKPIGKIAYVFYKERNEFFVLGSFAYTGKRLIFFPGLVDRRVTIAPDGSNPLENGILLNSDHYSLEENWRIWHITLAEKDTQGIKYGKRNTRKINNSLFRWFTFGVESTSRLELMPKTQEIRFSGANLPDLQRRYKIIKDARDNSRFPVIHLDDDPAEPHYLNFEFFVSTKLIKELKDFPEAIVDDLKNTSAIVNDPRTDVLVRNHQVVLNDFDGFIWIRVSKIRGNLSCGAITV
ncbi:MAG: hypothetical protein ACT4N5_07535 [Nitrosopumilaceae archaeon]